LRDLEQRLIELAITPEVWELAGELARASRQRGLTVPATDLLIAACARHHHARLEHANEHFSALEAI
jgi:hypothetical protein